MNAPVSSTPSAQPVDFDALVRVAVRPFTTAPLRIAGSFVFHADRDTLFHRVSEPDQIASWFALIRGGSTDHEASCSVGEWNAGSKRYCHTYGMGTLDETILYWDGPTAYSYAVKNPLMPIRDHAALMVVESWGPEKSRFTWHQYFELTGLVMRHGFKPMMLGMMNRGLAKLGEELGGEPSEMRWHD
ncbi:MAG: SRPBCC family protein [Myxococcota bacterium]